MTDTAVTPPAKQSWTAYENHRGTWFVCRSDGQFLAAMSTGYEYDRQTPTAKPLVCRPGAFFMLASYEPKSWTSSCIRSSKGPKYPKYNESAECQKLMN